MELEELVQMQVQAGELGAGGLGPAGERVLEAEVQSLLHFIFSEFGFLVEIELGLVEEREDVADLLHSALGCMER